MNRATWERLAKVMALADSSHEGEAIAALRAARSILAQDGLSFAALTSSANQNHPHKHPTPAQEMIGRLRKELDQLQQQRIGENAEMQQLQQMSHHLQKALRDSQREAAHWRKIAEQTAANLWEIARQIAEEYDLPRRKALAEPDQIWQFRSDADQADKSGQQASN